MSCSNYPPGGGCGPGPDEEVEQKCPTCGRTWTATMYFELGGWFFVDDNQAFCPDCGEEVV